MASTFNTDQFLSTEHKGAMDTKLIPCDKGEYRAQINTLKARKLEKEGEEPRIIMDVLWEVLDESQKKKTGLEKVFAKQGIFCDVLPNGSLDMGKGKNIQLGQLREALGQNRSDRPWAPKMLIGQVAKVAVEPRPDERNPEVVYNDVKRVTKA